MGANKCSAIQFKILEHAPIMTVFLVHGQKLWLVQYVLKLERDAAENDIVSVQQLNNQKNLTAQKRRYWVMKTSTGTV